MGLPFIYVKVVKMDKDGIVNLFGKDPSNEIGEYFKASTWSWYPLWDYCENLHNDLLQSLDKSIPGLDGLAAFDLGKRLLDDVNYGVAQKYVDERNNYLANLERTLCKVCDGTGVRTDEVGIANGMPTQLLSIDIQIITGRTNGYCNMCSGEGIRNNSETAYTLTVETIKKFGMFLINSGGYEIK